MRSNRWIVAGLLVALAGWTAVTSGLARGHIGEVPDDGLYFVAAQSLRDGKGYTLPNRPGPPIRSRYSIGFPAMLAVALRLAPGEPSLARDAAACRAVVDLACWAFGLATFAFLLRARAPRPAAALAALGAVFNPMTLQVGVTIMSDIPYAAMAAILLARWAGRRRGGPAPASALVDGLVAGLAFTVRANGVALVLGSLISAATGRRKLGATLACLLGAAAGAVPLTIYTRLATGPRVSGDYVEEMSAGWYSAAAGLATLTQNLRGTAIGLADLVSPAGSLALIARHHTLAWGIRIAVDLAIAAGAARLIRRGGRRAWPGLAFALVTVGILLIWPFETNSRFLLSLLPLAWLAFHSGLLWVGRRLGLGPAAARRAAITGLAAALVFNILPWLSSVRVALRHGGNYSVAAGPALSRATDEMLAYVRDRLEPDAVVAAEYPETVSLYTGRKVAKLMREYDLVRRRFGRHEGFDSLKSLMDAMPDRPYYIWTRGAEHHSRSGGGPDEVDLNQVAAYSRDPGLDLRVVHRTSDGILELVAVTRKDARPSAPPGAGR